MKYDKNQTLTRGAKRTLQAFNRALFELLQCQSFDCIKVQAICQLADYPRATFYNYFGDKYDLLEYSWSEIFNEITVENHVLLEPQEAFPLFFNHAYDFFVQKQSIIQRLLQYNPTTSSLYFSFEQYTIRELEKVFQDCINFEHQPVSISLLSRHIANTILLVLIDNLSSKNPKSRDECYKCFHYLLGKKW